MSYARWGCDGSEVYVYECRGSPPSESAWQIRVSTTDDLDSLHDTPGEAAERLMELRAMGVSVPQHAIDALRVEQQEINDGADKP